MLNKRWAGLLEGPGPAWARVRINTVAEFPGETVADAAAMMAWFSRRQGSITALVVTGLVPKLPDSLLASVLAVQAASLRVLRLEVAAVRLSGNDLAFLAALTGLEDLDIVLPPAPAAACWDDHSAAAMRTLSRLPAMKIIKFSWPFAGPRRILIFHLQVIRHFRKTTL